MTRIGIGIEGFEIGIVSSGIGIVKSENAGIGFAKLEKDGLTMG